MKQKIFLFLMLMIVSIGAMAQSVGSKFTVDGINYQITSFSPREVKVVDNHTLIGNMIVPSSVSYLSNPYSVIAVGVLGWNGNCTSITLPNTIRTIEANAFTRFLASDCDLTIPNSVTTIESGAFDEFSGNSIRFLWTSLAGKMIGNSTLNVPIFVPCGMKNDYKEAFPFMASQNLAYDKYTLNVVSTNTVYGTVTDSPYQNSLTECGTSLEITATPHSGYKFVKWDDGDRNATRTVVVSPNKTQYEASFAPIGQSLITVGTKYNNINGAGINVFVNGNHLKTVSNKEIITINDGSIVRLEGFVYNGQYIKEWYIDGACQYDCNYITTPSDITFTVNRDQTFELETEFDCSSADDIELHWGTIMENNKWRDSKNNPLYGGVYCSADGFNASGYYNSYRYCDINSINVELKVQDIPLNSRFIRWETSTGTVLSHDQSFFYQIPNTAEPGSQIHVAAVFGVKSYSIVVNANDNTMGTVSGAATVEYDTYHQISATPKPGYKFAKWSDDDTNPTRSVLVPSGGATYTANFAPNQYTITVSSNDVIMGTVNGSGTFDYNSTQTISASANTGYSFVNWNDGNTNATRSITVTGNATYTAEFAPNQYTITVSSNDAIMGTTSGSGIYNYNTIKEIEATPAAGYKFVKWSDGITSNPRTITITDDATYEAEFAVEQYTITVLSDDLLMGSVTGGGTFDYNSSQQSSATANTGYSFVQWSDGVTDNPRNITVPVDGASYTAEFAINQYQLSLNVGDNGMVEVSKLNARGAVEEIRGGDSYKGTFNHGDEVSLNAVADEGYHFVEWADDNSAFAQRSVTMTTDNNYAVSFAINSYAVTITVGAGGSLKLTVNGAEEILTTGTYNRTFEHFDNIIIEAIADGGYKFSKWEDNTTTNTRTFTVSGINSYSALFAPIATNVYTVTTSTNNPLWGIVIGGGDYAENADATLIATAKMGYRFVRWSDGVISQTRTITVTSAVTYTAEFESTSTDLTLTLLSSNTTMGTVSGGGKYKNGTSIIITAATKSGYEFEKWSDGSTFNPRRITVDRNMTLTAYFKPLKYTLTVQSSVKKSQDIKEYDYNSVVEVEAEQINGYDFEKWSDGLMFESREVIIKEDITLIAMYKKVAIAEDEDNQSNEFTLYPNPATSYVVLDGHVGNNYSIVDIQGRVVREGYLETEKTEIDLSNIREGIYFVRIGNQTKKLVVK